ncbi:hypothetical protein HNO89_000574 [Sporosarcina luteola]|nr:hypothetical protein [Sporosarcina luteola]
MRKFSFCILLATGASLLVWQSNSFSDTELRNEVTVAAVSEEDALLSVHYGEGREFWIGNNTDQQVEIQGPGFATDGTSWIGPGMFKGFTLTGHPKELVNGSITVHAVWDEGGAKIESFIPQSNIDVIMLELEEDQMDNPLPATELDQEEQKEEGSQGTDAQEKVETDELGDTVEEEQGGEGE